MSVPHHAQSSDEQFELSLDELFELSLEDLLKIKVTTSTKHDETLLSVPSAVTIVQADEIRRYGVRYLHQLMKFVPGYQTYRVDSSAVGYVVSNRGRRSGSGGQLLILMNGMRLNEDMSGGAIARSQLFGLDNVERVEFIRGPGSSLYGSNAFMGVINIITERAKELKAEIGSHQRQSTSAQWYWSGVDAEFRIHLRSEDDKGEQLGIYDPDPSVATEISSRDPYRWRTLHISAVVGDFSLQAYGSETHVGEFYAEGIASTLNERTPKDYFLELQYKRELMTDWGVSARLFASDRNLDFKTVLNKSADLGIFGISDMSELGAEFSVYFDNQQGKKAIVGMEFRQPDVEDTEACLFGPINSCFNQSEESHRTIRALYGQYQQQFNPQWEGIIGLRYDDYSDFGGNISPRLGLIYHLNRRNTFKLLYGQAFRPPSRIEADIENNPVYGGNPDLQPEIAATTELIWINSFTNGFLQVTLFDVGITDTIIDANTPPPILRINGGSESIAGIEIEYVYHFCEHWQARAALTHLADEPAGQVTESDTVLGGGLSYQNAGWTAALSANYQSEQKDPHDAMGGGGTDFNVLGGRTLFSFHLSYEWLPGLESYFDIENLSDKTYLSPALNSANIVGAANRGKTLAVGVSWKY